MKRWTHPLCSIVGAVVFGLLWATPATADTGTLLWYDEPAEKWQHAMQIGNGRLGAIIFGRIADEHIVLNEDTCWTGGPYDPSNARGAAAMPEIRKLIFDGKLAEAQALFGRTCMANNKQDPKDDGSDPQNHAQQKYQVLGDLHFRFPGHWRATDYRRELDLNTAVTTVEYTVDGVRYRRELFVSPVDQVLVMRLTADKPGKITFSVMLDGRINHKWPTDEGYAVTRTQVSRRSQPDPQGRTREIKTYRLALNANNATNRYIPGGLKYYAELAARPEGGRMYLDNNNQHDRINVEGANAVTLILAGATNFVSYKDVSADAELRVVKTFAALGDKTYDRMKADHITEHQRLFGRVKFTLPTTANSALPTDERLKRYADEADPQFASLLFQHGRYLLISSSRPGSQPANLQGLWNPDMHPSWGGKYTTNINLPMNYWPAEVCNLSECHEPLFDMLVGLADKGADTARLTYGAQRGWVLHHNTDLWRTTTPTNGPFWGTWPGGGAWLTTHLWEHYLFTEDKAFLEKYYPVMKGAAEFFLETLQEHPTRKWLVTCPSSSPENHPPGIKPSICAGPTIDVALLRYLFDACAQASVVLETDAEFRRQVLAARKRLPPYQVGQHGQLQEWLDDLDSPRDHHRHFSHLWGMYPGNDITLEITPHLAKAIATSLTHRGEGGTGFGMTWQTALWARLRNAERAHRFVKLEARVNTWPNLMGRCFGAVQVDSALGVTAGIAEMLIQSHSGGIRLLPALPKPWADGSVSGLCARGGFVIDMTWADGKLTKVKIHSKLGRPAVVRYGDLRKIHSTEPGQTITLNGELELQ